MWCCVVVLKEYLIAPSKTIPIGSLKSRLYVISSTQNSIPFSLQEPAIRNVSDSVTYSLELPTPCLADVFMMEKWRRKTDPEPKWLSSISSCTKK